MPAGETLGARQQQEILRALRNAEKESNLPFSVYVGALEGDSRERAVRLHAATDRPADTVLVAVDPGRRQVEVVTGTTAKHWLDDYACGLAALSMTGQFAVGDLTGGIVNGLRTLAEHARHPKVLHTDQP